MPKVLDVDAVNPRMNRQWHCRNYTDCLAVAARCNSKMKGCKPGCQSFIPGGKQRDLLELQSEVLKIGMLIRAVFYPARYRWERPF